MNHYGNIRKMYSELKDEVEYALPLYDSTTPSLKVNLNNLIGSTIKISFSGIINCVVTGKKIRKAYFRKKICFIWRIFNLRKYWY